jgi:hypothetical protein
MSGVGCRDGRSLAHAERARFGWSLRGGLDAGPPIEVAVLLVCRGEEDRGMVPTRQERPVDRSGAEGFEAVSVVEDGVEQRVPWPLMPDVVAELGRPVRSFPSYRGQRNCRAGTGRRRWAA